MLTRLRRTALLLSAAAVLSTGAHGSSAAAPGRLHLSDPEGVGARAAVSSGVSYAFSTLLGGKPVRWDPCRRIHWRFNPAGAPRGGFAAVKLAVARVGQATRTTWVYDGTASTVPTTNWLPKTSSARPPILIGWSTPARTDLLRNQPSTNLGVTRTTWYSMTGNGRTDASIHGAVIALNQNKRLPLTGSVSWYAVTLHELGHAVGLGHAASSRELMYPMLQPGLHDLQSGDLTGLVKVGRTQGCLAF